MYGEDKTSIEELKNTLTELQSLKIEILPKSDITTELNVSIEKMENQIKQANENLLSDTYFVTTGNETSIENVKEEQQQEITTSEDSNLNILIANIDTLTEKVNQAVKVETERKAEEERKAKEEVVQTQNNNSNNTTNNNKTSNSNSNNSNNNVETTNNNTINNNKTSNSNSNNTNKTTTINNTSSYEEPVEETPSTPKPKVGSVYTYRPNDGWWYTPREFWYKCDESKWTEDELTYVHWTIISESGMDSISFLRDYYSNIEVALGPAPTLEETKAMLSGTSEEQGEQLNKIRYGKKTLYIFRD